jgi:hypothetical protein
MTSVVNASQVLTVEVPPKLVASRIINLDAGDKFTGSLSIFGGTGQLAGQIACSVDDPTGQLFEIFEHGIVSWGGSFEFTANKSGAYTFYFANPDQQDSRTVTLSYDVASSQNFLSFLISSGILWVLVGLVILVVFMGLAVILSRRKGKSKTNPTSDYQRQPSPT